MNQRRTFGLLFSVVALCAFGTAQTAFAQAPNPYPVRIRVDSVMAANTEEGMDSRLDKTPMGERLKALFEYTTYRLIVHEEKQTVCGRMVAFDLPGGRILHIAPRTVVNNMISMELVLFEGPRPVMTTDLKLMNRAILIVGGPRYQQGMLITTIVTEAKGISRQHGHNGEASSPPIAVTAPPAPPSIGTTPGGPIPAASTSPPTPPANQP